MPYHLNGGSYFLAVCRAWSRGSVGLENRSIVESLEEKVLELIERTDHLVALVSADSLHWAPTTVSPSTSAINVGQLLGHLLDCVAGFCACFQSVFPQELRRFEGIRQVAVNHSCEPLETRRCIAAYREQLVAGFALCNDLHLAQRIPTVFVPSGETLMTLLLGNLEHVVNHKYQLFMYLKLQGAEVSTRDLYRFRAEE